jgi:hypothetical protein
MFRGGSETVLCHGYPHRDKMKLSDIVQALFRQFHDQI